MTLKLDDETKKLIETHKVVDEPKMIYNAPAPGRKLTIKLASQDMPGDRLLLTVYESTRNSAVSIYIDSSRKSAFQTLHGSDPLVRVDIDANAKHTNPDGTLIKGSHAHIRTTDSGARWAFPITLLKSLR